MKIKKLGHCCFVMEPVIGLRIMTDPGEYSDLQNTETNIQVVLITHEHPDHLHIESLKKVLENNPDCLIITNTAVGKLLDDAGIKYSIVEDGQDYEIAGVKIHGFGNVHEEVYEKFGQVQNTGYMINNLCYPGDSFANPNMPIDILALPVAGPWMRIKDAIKYALELKPRAVFPVHDGMIVETRPGPIYRLPSTILPENNIEFKKLEIGIEEEI